VNIALDNDVVKVTVKRAGEGWKLTVIGVRPGHKEPSTFYRARCETIDAALEQFCNWRKGVIIV
jgi:hypothetical protein